MRSWLAVLVLTALPWPPQEGGPADRFASAIARDALAWQLSEPDEVRTIVGTPTAENAGRDGGMEVKSWAYGDSFVVFFVREAGTSRPFLLAGASDGARRLGPEPGLRVALRTTADLAKLRPFTGLQNVDVSRLDLRAASARLQDLPFDTRTAWPPADRLPEGFDPARLLRDARNPGLGLRALHAGGIDGRDVTIGIIDQPLLDHRETRGRLTMVAAIDVDGVPAQMHGPAVASLAAGTECGVAPRAQIAYVAIPMWKAQNDNALYIEALERLLAWNATAGGRLRVVSISYGGFQQAARSHQWRQLIAKAEAQGVLIITCDPIGSQLEYGMLRPLPGGDREKPDGYAKGTYGSGLLVPADGRTYANHEADGGYSYGPKGGMSWAAPYLAGLAALGFQVNPDLTPARIRAYLVRSAASMPFGHVVDPAAFVRLCRDDPDRVH